MSSKDKLIGVALILLGLGFIALGVVFGGGLKTAGTQNNVYYQEQPALNGETEEEINPVDVYFEEEVDENVEEETEQEDTNRYIY